jgi:hypothetical protein
VNAFENLAASWCFVLVIGVVVAAIVVVLAGGHATTLLYFCFFYKFSPSFWALLSFFSPFFQISNVLRVNC